MTITTRRIGEFAIHRMLRNSLVLMDKRTQEVYYIHRDIFNRAQATPELPLIPVQRRFEDKLTVWLGAISTL